MQSYVINQTYAWTMYFVASSEMRATWLRFLADEDVACDAAMNHAGVPGACSIPETQ